jgi:hypothetical protein
MLVGLAIIGVLLVGAALSGRCYAPTEDSSVAHCQFDPGTHYEYDHGYWHPTDRSSAPLGRDLTADPNPADD